MGSIKRPGAVAAPRSIGILARVVMALVGVTSWIGGGVASFIGSNGAGAAALVAVGAASGGIAVVGAWPSRISLSGNEVSWDDINQAVDSQIKVASAGDEPNEVLAELQILRQRLEALQRTGSAPNHPAQVYDEEVMDAIKRLVPEVFITKSEPRTRSTPDFSVRTRRSQLYLETKWRPDTLKPYAGSTLPQLLAQLPAGSKLLVVVNAPASSVRQAQAVVSDSIGDNGRVVAWRTNLDDPQLAEALTALLEHESSS